MTNLSSSTVVITGDTYGGGRAGVILHPGESHSFNKAWVETIGEALVKGSMEPFRRRLVDPDDIQKLGSKEKEKIQNDMWPWRHHDIRDSDDPC